MTYFKILKEAEMTLSIKTKDFVEAYICLIDDDVSNEELASSFRIPAAYVQNISKEEYLKR